ncbi:lecithin retinol acyltransferase family protein [Aeromonas veronii]|uniref:lecithin retinol acyltransferase family protein n=1 Tax=Aeromonas veronii TaxID=654 RepID=UPI003C6EE8EC
MTRHFIIGDHLVTPQPEGHHHGLFVGHDQVIHCLPFTSGEHSGQLTLTSLAQFSQHCAIEVKPHAMRLFSREESLTRAYARLNEGEQGQPFASGEQFVTWCIEGLVRSPQVAANRCSNGGGCRSRSSHVRQGGHQCNGRTCCQHPSYNSWR